MMGRRGGICRWAFDPYYNVYVVSIADLVVSKGCKLRYEHRGASRGTNIEVLCAASPEALAHSPSHMPLSCPVAPPSQRELHKDGGGGGGGVARSARAARAPKAKSCATSCETPSATSCAASFTCPSFMCHLRAG